MFSKFFHLKMVDPETALVTRATWLQRLQWLISGCPLRSEAVVTRFVELKHRSEAHGNPLMSNTHVH